MGNPALRELLAVLSIITVSIFSITVNKNETEKELIPVYVIEFQPWELVLDVAWAPDGNLLAVSSGNFVRLFSASDFELVNSVEINALTHTLSFDKKSEYLAAGSRDGYLRIWRISDFYKPDIEPIQPVANINAHRHGVNQLDFDSEGKWLMNCVTNSYDMSKSGQWQHLEATVETSMETAGGHLALERGSNDTATRIDLWLDNVQIELLEAP